MKPSGMAPKGPPVTPDPSHRLSSPNPNPTVTISTLSSGGQLPFSSHQSHSRAHVLGAQSREVTTFRIQFFPQSTLQLYTRSLGRSSGPALFLSSSPPYSRLSQRCQVQPVQRRSQDSASSRSSPSQHPTLSCCSPWNLWSCGSS